MTPQDVDRLKRLHQRFGTKKFSASDLVSGFRNISVGHKLRKLTGVVVDGWRLCRERDNNLKSWRYFFKESVPVLDEMRTDAEAEERLNVASPGGQVRQIAKRLETMMVADRVTGEPVSVTFTYGKGLNGELVKVPELPEPKAAPARVDSENPSHDPRPPWLRRGDLKPRDRAEWQAWQDRKLPAVSFDSPVIGFADPGGIVSRAIIEERGTRVHVTGPWPGGWQR